MIIRRMFQSVKTLQDNCLLVYCAVAWQTKVLSECVQSLFLQKEDFKRLVINRIYIVCTK